MKDRALALWPSPIRVGRQRPGALPFSSFWVDWGFTSDDLRSIERDPESYILMEVKGRWALKFEKRRGDEQLKKNGKWWIKTMRNAVYSYRYAPDYLVFYTTIFVATEYPANLPTTYNKDGYIAVEPGDLVQVSLKVPGAGLEVVCNRPRYSGSSSQEEARASRAGEKLEAGSSSSVEVLERSEVADGTGAAEGSQSALRSPAADKGQRSRRETPPVPRYDEEVTETQAADADEDVLIIDNPSTPARVAEESTAGESEHPDQRERDKAEDESPKKRSESSEKKERESG